MFLSLLPCTDCYVMVFSANFTLPEEGVLFDTVEFIELDKEEATKLVEEYVKEGKAACPPPSKKSRFEGKSLIRF